MTAVVVKGAGPNDNIEQQVDPSHQAGRISLRPVEHQLQGGQAPGGHYTTIFGYSNTAAKPAAGSDVVSFRWADTKMLFLLKRLLVWAVTTTAYTASANQDLALLRANAFSVAASGGTQIVPAAGPAQRARISGMGPTLLGTTSGLLWASSGDLLTVGTRTLDTQGAGYFAYLNAITPINAPSFGVLYDQRNSGEHPWILGVNEGFVIQTPIGNGQAAGVTKYTFVMEHAEVPAY
jgi:hypothetical protein